MAYLKKNSQQIQKMSIAYFKNSLRIFKKSIMFSIIFMYAGMLYSYVEKNYVNF